MKLDPEMLRAIREDAEAFEPDEPRAPYGWWIIPGAMIGLLFWAALAWWWL